MTTDTPARGCGIRLAKVRVSPVLASTALSWAPRRVVPPGPIAGTSYVRIHTLDTCMRLLAVIGLSRLPALHGARAAIQSILAQKLDDPTWDHASSKELAYLIELPAISDADFHFYSIAW